MVQRRYIGILQCAAVAIGVPALFAEKKLHAFRVQCTNVLGSTGALKAEREAHICWQSTVQSRHFASLKHTALNARTGHLLAQRSGRDDPPHPMWQCLAQAPGDYVTGVEVPDSQFQKLVTERVAAGNPEREDSPTYLFKRLKQLEQENATLRQKKRSRPEDAAAELKELELKHQSGAAEFPAQCARPPERADRGRIGPRKLRPGPEHRGRQGARPHPRARRRHDQARARRAAAPRCPWALLASVGRRRSPRSAPARCRGQHQELASVQGVARRVEAAKRRQLSADS
jgi:hypothetical protein